MYNNIHKEQIPASNATRQLPRRNENDLTAAGSAVAAYYKFHDRVWVCCFHPFFASPIPKSLLWSKRCFWKCIGRILSLSSFLSCFQLVSPLVVSPLSASANLPLLFHVHLFSFFLPSSPSSVFSSYVLVRWVTSHRLMIFQSTAPFLSLPLFCLFLTRLHTISLLAVGNFHNERNEHPDIKEPS